MTMPAQPSKPQADATAPDPATGAGPAPVPQGRTTAPPKTRGGLGTVARQFVGPSGPVGKRRVPGHAREAVTDQRSTRSPDEGFGRRGRGFRICSAMPQVRQSRDHGRLPPSTSVNVAFRIRRAMPRGHSAMIMAVWPMTQPPTPSPCSVGRAATTPARHLGLGLSVVHAATQPQHQQARQRLWNDGGTGRRFRFRSEEASRALRQCA